MSKHQVTFTPSVCEPQVVKEDGKPDWTKEPEYEGTITVRMPSYDERLELYDAGGLGTEAAESRDTKQAIALMRHVVRSAAPFVVAINVKRKADGYVFSWDDMLHDSDMGKAVTEVANRLIGKHAVGNAA